MYTPNVGQGHDPAEQVKMIAWYDGSNKPIHVILSEHSESKDLRTDFPLNVSKMRRSLDSISFRSG